VKRQKCPWPVLPSLLVKPAVAIAELEKLKAEAADPLAIRPTATFSSWRTKVESVLSRSLGPKHHTVEAFRKVRYHLGIYFDGQGHDPDRKSYLSGVQESLGYIDAAIYELGLLAGGDEPVDQRAYDPELWEHVRGLVDAEEWGKVASQTAIFVESRVRTWTGVKDKNGDDLVGKGLFATALSDDGEYRLGKRRGEWEGWRMLGMGFAQALGNVDRHHISERDDARRYAIGVLGLGSLILTQLRHEHADHFAEE
jgi:Protein of unknown function (Hypoth_ymh)